ncbi:hypothetical protein LINPERPRIM_LOCUS6934 [Linum perenne]
MDSKGEISNVCLSIEGLFKMKWMKVSLMVELKIQDTISDGFVPQITCN